MAQTAHTEELIDYRYYLRRKDHIDPATGKPVFPLKMPTERTDK